MAFQRSEQPKTVDALQKEEADLHARCKEGSPGDIFMKGVRAADNEIVRLAGLEGER